MARSRSRSRSPHRADHRREERRDRDSYHPNRSRNRSHSPRDKRKYEQSRHDSRQTESRHRNERSPKRRRHDDDSSQRKVSLEIGLICQGKVRSIKPFGCFVELIGYNRDALIFHSHISEDLNFQKEDEDADRINALQYFCPIGSQVWLKIIEIKQTENGEKINGSMVSVDQENGKDLDPSGSLVQKSSRGGNFRQENGSSEPPEIGSVHKAKVASIRPFGAFVQLQGFKANGLVHVSQISDHLGFDREDSDDAKVAALSEIISVGEEIFVKVVEVKESDPDSGRGPKIGCSIKLVSQKDGTDLDPNSLKFKPRSSDGGNFGGRAPVGANAGQIQSGQIDWGHLNAEKIGMVPQTGNYELLGSDGEEPRKDAEGNDFLPPPPKKGLKKQQKIQSTGIKSVEEAMAVLQRHKKQKKDKKKHKHKKEEKEKKKRKSKRHKSEKKKKNKCSSSSESSQ